MRPGFLSLPPLLIVTDLSRRVGVKYDTVRVYAFVSRLAILKYLGLKTTLGEPDAQQVSQAGDAPVHFLVQVVPVFCASHLWACIAEIGFVWSFSVPQVICTDAIFTRLMEASSELRTLVERARGKLDYNVVNSWSINDVETLNRLYPRQLRRVRLAPVKSVLGLYPRGATAAFASTAGGVPANGRGWQALTGVGERASPARPGFWGLVDRVWDSLTSEQRTFMDTLALTYNELPVPLKLAARGLAIYIILRVTALIRLLPLVRTITNGSRAIVNATVAVAIVNLGLRYVAVRDLLHQALSPQTVRSARRTATRAIRSRL